MSINSGLIANYDTLQDRIITYMYATKEYGKPSAEALEYFWENFGAEIKSNQFRMDTVDRDVLDEKWFNITECCRDGGYAWYEKLAEIDFSGKTDEEIVAILQNVYVVEEKVADAFLKSDTQKEVQPKKPKYTMEDLKANYVNRLLNGQAYAGEEIPKVPEAEHSDKSEVAQQSEIAKEAEQSKNAEKSSMSDKANDLTDAGKEEMFNFFMKKQEQEKEAKRKDLTYTPDDLGTYTSSSLLYNARKLEEAINRMNENHTLYVLGNTNSGKTHMCKEIAAKLCNVDYDKISDGLCKGGNLLMISASIGKDKFTGTETENGIFPRFCEYNKDSDFCLLIINEAEKNAVENILNPIWEKLKKFAAELEKGIVLELSTGIQVTIPKNLYIITNVAISQYDDQMNSRFRPVIDLDEFNYSDVETLSSVTKLPSEMIRKLIELNIASREQTTVVRDKYRYMKSVLSVYDLLYNTKSELFKLASASELMFGEEWEQLAKDLRQYAEGM